MTVKQRQCLLLYLSQMPYNQDLNPGGIDGIDGPKTQKAMAAFTKRYGVGEDGLVGAVSGAVPPIRTDNAAFWDGIRYFRREEFRCKCGKCGGFPVEPGEELVRLMDKIRAHFGVPIGPFHSAIRCPQHNAETPGSSKTSQHMAGKAVDFHVDGVPHATVAAYAETLLPNTGGIGIYSWGVHVDTRADKSRWRE